MDVGTHGAKSDVAILTQSEIRVFLLSDQPDLLPPEYLQPSNDEHLTSFSDITHLLLCHYFFQFVPFNRSPYITIFSGYV